jgi:hypothetical protein
MLMFRGGDLSGNASIRFRAVLPRILAGSTMMADGRRSNLPRRARSLRNSDFGPDGARAFAPALEKMVGLKELGCILIAARQFARL